MAKSKSNGKVATATAGLKKNPVEKKEESEKAINAAEVESQTKKPKSAVSTQPKAAVKEKMKSAKSYSNGAKQKRLGRKRKLLEAEEPEVAQQLEEEESDDGIEVTYEGFNEDSDDEKTAGEDQNNDGSDDESDEIPLPDDSDDDDEDDAPDATDEVEHTADEFLANLPKILLPGGDATENSRRSGRIAGLKPGVICLSRIPHGFYEQEMKQYFSQFGDVTRVRLSRNKKTGASKHYAFIEFAAEEVAKIAAETMNNYLLFNHILNCRFVPDEEVHPNTFVGANRKFKAIPWRKIHIERQNKPKSEEQEKVIGKRLKKKDELTRKKLADAGIDYNFVGYADDSKAVTMDVDKVPSAPSRKAGTKKGTPSSTKEYIPEPTKNKSSAKKSAEVEKNETSKAASHKSASENGETKPKPKQAKANTQKVAPSAPPKKKQKK